MDKKTKQRKLNKIAKEIIACPECKKGKIGIAVPGEGDPDAKVVFVGEAPGKQEAEEGRPFVGRAGKVLREQIERAGLSEDEVFITSAVKYFPKHKTPTDAEIEHGRDYLFRQLQIIDPKIVVLLGRVAIQAVLHKNVMMSEFHGKVIEKDGVKYFITYHPAACLHNPKIRPKIINDFKKLAKIY